MRCVVIATIGIVCVSLSALAQEKPLTTAEAKQHVGQTATVCGKVMTPRYASSTKGQPTFLNMDKTYPSQEFTVVIWGSDRAKFNTPETEFRDKAICVTGKIQNYRGESEIVATDPKQIHLQEK